MWQDFRSGLRLLFNQPGFALLTVATLALGIGANTALFSVINALILQPPHIAEADRVAALWQTPKDKYIEGYVSYLTLQDWRSRSQSFAAIAGYKPHSMVMQNETHAERIPGMRVTANFLSLLQVKLHRGRDFQVEEEKRGAPNVVLVGYQFWQDRLGGKENMLGETIQLDSRPFTIIGILPPGFEFPLATRQTDLLTTIAGESGNLEQRGAQVLRVIGRLQAGANFVQAQTELTAIATQLEQKYPAHAKDVTAHLRPIGEQIVGRETRGALWVLLGAVGFVLLIACTNVTNLLLVRASTRQKELALRAALGAGVWRIARHLLLESLVLSLLAGGVGLLLAMWGLAALRYFGAEQLPRLEEVQISAPVLMFTLVVAVVTALLSSLLPVYKASRPDINEVLKAGARTATIGGSLRWWRDVLVVAEVALGMVLLVGAGLMLRSFNRVVNISPGFDPTNVLTGAIGFTRADYEEHPKRVAYVTQSLTRLKALPGVESAAFVAPMPFSGGNVGSDFRIEGRAKPAPGDEPTANNRSVTAEYFQALRIPLRKGRYFTEQDQRTSLGVAIINETLARLYFANEDPVGKIISNIGANQNEGDPERWQVVGVVGDVHHSSLTNAAAPELYLPYQQNSWSWGNFFVRTTNDAVALTKSFTETIRAGDKTVPVTNVRLLTHAIATTFSQARFYTMLFTLFGLTGLVLTLTGIYSVISYSVTQRTPEIGIRLALGAEAKDVLRLVLGQGLVLTGIGIALGLAASFGLTRLLGNLLFDLSATDPLTFIGIALLLAAVALVACLIPTWRAAKVDPLTALRYE